jgi:hypothetical protein
VALSVGVVAEETGSKPPPRRAKNGDPRAS